MASCFLPRFSPSSNYRPHPILKLRGSHPRQSRLPCHFTRNTAIRQKRSTTNIPPFSEVQIPAFVEPLRVWRIRAQQDKTTPTEIVEESVEEEAPAPDHEEEEVPLTPEDFWSPQAKGLEEGFQDDYGEISPVPEHDGTKVFETDSMLWDHQEHFRFRWNTFRNIRQAIKDNEKGMDNFTKGNHHLDNDFEVFV